MILFSIKNFKTDQYETTFDVSKKELVFIIGKSGIGKTTLIHKCCDNKLLHDSIIRYTEKFGCVLQDFGLFTHMTVYDNIAFGAIYHNIKGYHDKIIKYFQRWGISNLSTKYPKDISGGQKQKVAIIRQLILNNDIVFMDEPTSALDQVSIRQLESIIIEKLKYTSFVIVTHNINFINNFKIKYKIINLDK